MIPNQKQNKRSNAAVIRHLIHGIVIIMCLLCNIHNSLSVLNAQNGLFLPFLDDFSSYTGNPDGALWQNGGCNVNTGYQFMPPTVGVVTLDILDSRGKLYEHANIYSFSADTLTSVSIRMDSVREPVNKKIQVSDSVYLSFFVQPGGSMGNMWERIGTAPSVKDSLIVQFYKSKQNAWQTVWSVKGTSVDTVYKYDSVYFIQVMIPVRDTEYFNSDFRFRFINYGSLDDNPSYDYVTNKGQWNIDYVYMNINRSSTDKTFRDIAFVNPAKSLLKDFTAIPAKHFSSEYMKEKLYIKIVNLYSSTLNSNYSYYVTDADNHTVHSYSGGYENIVSYPNTHRFQTAANHAQPKVDFSYSPAVGKFSYYNVTHVVTEGVGQDNIRNNDTTHFIQRFENYFAYDDGTAEGGIGVEPGSSSMMAVRYPLLSQDTLYAIDIYFNNSRDDANLKPFYFYIYSATDDSLLLPDQELYASSRFTPVFDSLNKFVRYYLDEPLVLDKGNFFIVIKPHTSTYLNIGFDQNNDVSHLMFEKKLNQWYNIFLKGAPMIRPYFGYVTVGLEKPQNVSNEINVYPNPAKDFAVLSTDGEIYSIKITDMQGKTVYTSDTRYPSYSATVDVSFLRNGVYVLQVNNQTKKLIIAR